MEVGHKHRSRFDVGVNHVLVIVHVWQAGGINRRGGFRGSSVGRLVARSTFLLAGQRSAAIFRVDGSVVSEEEIATNKSRSAFRALEWSLLRGLLIYNLVMLYLYTLTFV
jgi:hypothetical protein